MQECRTDNPHHFSCTIQVLEFFSYMLNFVCSSLPCSLFFFALHKYTRDFRSSSFMKDISVQQLALQICLAYDPLTGFLVSLWRVWHATGKTFSDTTNVFIGLGNVAVLSGCWILILTWHMFASATLLHDAPVLALSRTNLQSSKIPLCMMCLIYVFCRVYFIQFNAINDPEFPRSQSLKFHDKNIKRCLSFVRNRLQSNWNIFRSVIFKKSKSFAFLYVLPAARLESSEI